MQKSYSFSFDLGTFPTTVYVLFGFAELEEAIDHFDLISDTLEYNDDDEDSLAFTIFERRTGNCYLLFKDKVLDISDLQLIVHEINHAVYYILDYYDTDINEQTTEVSAYMTDFIFKKITQFLQKKQGMKLTIKKE